MSVSAADQPPPYDTIVFDCDSTLSSIEGIEELARDLDALERRELARLTAAAMDGELPLEQAYGARLELVAPRADELRRVAERYRECQLPHAQELIAALQFLGKRVAVVSGGVTPAVRPFAAGLGVPDDLIFAVDLFFGSDGSYTGFDQDSPLARSGGKPLIIQQLRQRFGPAPIALIGDGATDLEAAPAVERFIAYGGVVARKAILNAAACCCVSADMAALLPLLCSDQEVEKLGSHGAHTMLVEAARTLTTPSP